MTKGGDIENIVSFGSLAIAVVFSVAICERATTGCLRVLAGLVSRSLEPITRGDLQRLASFSKRHREEWFRHDKPTGGFQGRFLCSALCQGAALHHVDGTNGVKDFDIYEFYADLPDVTIPYRAHWCYDFGPSKFGRQENAKLHPEYEGRRVDLFVRALPVEMDADPIGAVQAYLKKPRTTTARMLAEKAVVILEPDELLGTVAWPIATV